MDVKRSFGPENCIIIEDSDDENETKNNKTSSETIIISDTEESKQESLGLQTENMNVKIVLENQELVKMEENEELESDRLYQRLKKKLLDAKSAMEQQSLKSLMEKRREKITKEVKHPTKADPVEVEDCKFRMHDTDDSFRLKDTGGGSQNSFWSLPSKSDRDEVVDVSDYIAGNERSEIRNSDKHEKELKESIRSMETTIQKKSVGKKNYLKSLEKETTSRHVKDRVAMDPSLRSHVKQIHRNPRLQPSDKKTLEEENRKAGMAERLGPSNKGFDMLRRMGYKEGEGLGRDGEGRTEPVDIQVRRGKEGLGR
eukprot:GFUD01035258.1.p1 GENE.GFUD01035258.1~~GFUD01035258.1.p1  ORF type:complete len:313 (-),score=108.23 GFUD01035258.1:98-1036(-)